jgi:hypothetical protein
LAFSETEKGIAHRVGAKNVGAPAILGRFAPTVWKEKKKDDSDTLGRTGTIRREQWERSHRREKTEPQEDETKQSPQEKKWWYACRLFGTNNLKEGAI